MAAGSRQLGYKSALNEIEGRSPGTKASFYLGFIERMARLLIERKEHDVAGLSPCTRCGAATPGDVCLLPSHRERLVGRSRSSRPADQSGSSPPLTPLAFVRQRPVWQPSLHKREDHP
jgi:hypothetical protein